MTRSNPVPHPDREESLSDHVLDLPLGEILDVAAAWWQANHLLDDLDTDRLRDDLRHIDAACQDDSLTIYRDILDNTDRVIMTAAGVERLNAFATTEAKPHHLPHSKPPRCAARSRRPRQQ